MDQAKPKNQIKIYKIIQKEETVFEFFLEKIENDKVTTEKLIVSAGVLSTLGLLKPTVITQAQYEMIAHENMAQKAYYQGLNYLSYRKRSVEEVRRYLVKKTSYTTEIIETVITKLLSQNYLNDEVYVTSYIQSALKTSFAGPGKMRQGLKDAGCAAELIETALAVSFPTGTQAAQLARLLAKMNKKKYFSRRMFFDKFNQKAVELGYNYELINQIKAQNTATNITVDEVKIQKTLQKTYARLQKKGQDAFKIKQGLQRTLQTKGIDQGAIVEYISDFYNTLGKNDET